MKLQLRVAIKQRCAALGASPPKRGLRNSHWDASPTTIERRFYPVKAPTIEPAPPTSHRRNRQSSLTRAVALVVAFALITTSLASDAEATEADPEATALATVEAFEGVFFNQLPPGFVLEEIEAPAQVHLGGVSLALPTDLDGVAHSANGNVFRGQTADTGDLVVITERAFAVVTENHGPIEYRFPVTLPTGTRLMNRSDGSIHHVGPAAQMLGMIEPAYAIDEAGASHPASYSFEAETNTLVMKADTTDADGLVLVDPGWRCKLKLAALGIIFLLGIIGWFTGAWWAMYVYLKALPYISSGVAASIARSCA